MRVHRWNAGRTRQAGPGRPRHARLPEGGWPGKACAGAFRANRLPARNAVSVTVCPRQPVQSGHRHSATRWKAIYDADPHRGDCVPGIARTGTGQPTPGCALPLLRVRRPPPRQQLRRDLQRPARRAGHGALEHAAITP
ncbi:hypothetical protein SDC9_211234 [bioreactor metagenome]|uniref:Uncharacterized protein n=1 Tax=bioreactor metagenome TaxID=1076179 RepID=A0A645JIF3_9ZZZZ